MASVSRVFLSPGLFGFKVLGSYDYFRHFEAGIVERFARHGGEARVHVSDVHPTSSIPRRAATLFDCIERHAGDEGALHLVGHSTGGLDARMVASPTVNLRGGGRDARWRSRLRSVTTMNTPHHGTPLASFFATLSGQRLLYAVSALTVTALKLGAPPLALTSSLVAAFGRLDGALGLELKVIDRATEGLVRLLDDASSADLRRYLRKLRDDQGAIIQLSPEGMDLFDALCEDDPLVHYQCVVSYAPAPDARHWARLVRSPLQHLSTPIFATMYRLTGLENAVYPCEPWGGAADAALLEALGHVPPSGASDGVVPVRSQIWGSIAWAGLGDHLDVVGHFAGGGEGRPHVDWLCSGASFDARRFDAMLDAVVDGMLRAERGEAPPPKA